ncbi:hypothetical protein TNCV_4026541 [Trichonephila clavipes]|nr:hypothetical protein TNCV_4026541 [Trichonephila clavipes]
MNGKDGSLLDFTQIADAGVFCDLFPSTLISALIQLIMTVKSRPHIYLALHQISACLSTPDNAIILYGSSSAIQALASNHDKSSRVQYCKAEFQQRLSSSGGLPIVAFGEIKWRTF